MKDRADARDQARRMRIDYKKDRKKPDWAVVQLQVLRPLVEVRDQIRDFVAKLPELTATREDGPSHRSPA